MVARTTAQTTNNDEIQVDHNRDGIERRGVSSDNVLNLKRRIPGQPGHLRLICPIYPQIPAQTMVQ